MQIFSTKSDLKNMPWTTPKEIKNRIEQIVTALDDNYEEHRKLDEDGGIVCLIEDNEDYKTALKDELEIEIGASVVEYVEVIQTETEPYLNCLIPANNEYAISIRYFYSNKKEHSSTSLDRRTIKIKHVL